MAVSTVHGRVMSKPGDGSNFEFLERGFISATATSLIIRLAQWNTGKYDDIIIKVREVRLATTTLLSDLRFHFASDNGTTFNAGGYSQISTIQNVGLGTEIYITDIAATRGLVGQGATGNFQGATHGGVPDFWGEFLIQRPFEFKPTTYVQSWWAIATATRLSVITSKGLHHPSIAINGVIFDSAAAALNFASGFYEIWGTRPARV